MFRWTLRMQCCKSRRILSDKKMKHFCLRSELDPKEFSLFEENFFRQNVSMRTWSSVLTTPPIFYRQRAWKYFSKIPNYEKVWFSRKSCFCSKFFTWIRRIQSWQRCQESINRRQKAFRSLSKNNQINNFLEKKGFYRNVSINTQNADGQTHWKIFAKKRKIFAQIMEIIWNKRYFILEKQFHLKVFVWTLRIQFWPLRRKLVDRKPKLCRSKFDNDKKNNFITIYSPKMFQ